MRAVQFSGYGDPSVLRVVGTDSPHAGPGQIRVAVQAAPLASGTTAILLTIGVAVLALVIGGVAVYLSLSGEDRGGMRALTRHPLRTIFAPPTRDDDDLEAPGDGHSPTG